MAAALLARAFRSVRRTALFTQKSSAMSTVTYMAGYEDEKQCQKALARIALTFNDSDTWELRHEGALHRI